MKDKKGGIDVAMIREAAGMAFIKLDPLVEARNPVMFVVWAGTVLSSLAVFLPSIADRRLPGAFELQLLAWLWFTLLFANFAESLAEAQGKARADSLRGLRDAGKARVLDANDRVIEVEMGDLRKGDRVVCVAGDIVPGDGEVIEGVASVDESAITGESAPVVREAGGDRSAVTGGTCVISDRIVVRITADPGSSFLDRMVSMVENATRQKTPGEIALTILLSTLSLVFLIAVVTLKAFDLYTARSAGGREGLDILSMTALLVCLIPTTIGGLLSSIGIAGVTRLLKRNLMALSGRAIEAAGDLDTLLVDKTGTITHGNRRASELVPARGVAALELARVAVLASLADTTPEGRSILAYVSSRKDLAVEKDGEGSLPSGAIHIPFSAATRMSGLDFLDGEGRPDPALSARKGAVASIALRVVELGGRFPPELEEAARRIARSGGTPLAVARGPRALGLIHLKDIVKEGIKERFEALEKMGIRTIMITGDNALTAAAIAAEAGVSDFVAEARPEAKLEIIRSEQAGGRLVGMIGDGTNDAPALAQADVGVAMASGSQTAREAGNMVDFDSDPTKIIDVVEVGKRLLITRGSLTTFSIANDVAKYFAIIPALFAGFYAPSGGKGPLAALDLMRLGSPRSAILSAVIFNALVIIALIPLALRGASFTPGESSSRLLSRNLLVYGLGGIAAPFAGIKLIDLCLNALGLA